MKKKTSIKIIIANIILFAPVVAGLMYIGFSAYQMWFVNKEIVIMFVCFALSVVVFVWALITVFFHNLN